MRHNGKVLLQCPVGTQEYAVIGGHISAMETAAQTLVREYREELYAEIAVGDLLCVAENFFPWGSKPCHQVCFFYEVKLLNTSIPMEGSFHGFDDNGNERMDLDFSWVPVKQIKNGLTVYPEEIVPYLLCDDLKNGYFLART